ncbi:MAG: hypothetical protein II655_14250, partial [Thermoguttaceae bacterium]|nr:hypothetical protein [Thermoguttaceae bacterium]
MSASAFRVKPSARQLIVFVLFKVKNCSWRDLQTKKRVTNDFDYFKRLHECILTKASKEMRDADLLDLF